MAMVYTVTKEATTIREQLLLEGSSQKLKICGVIEDLLA